MVAKAISFAVGNVGDLSTIGFATALCMVGTDAKRDIVIYGIGILHSPMG